jgi:Large ribosomal RNA subunit accumulation protein YceD
MPGHADAQDRPPFSRPLLVEEVPPDGMDLTISATDAERHVIAAQDGLAGLAKLEGSLHVEPWRKDGLVLTGEMRARVTQVCVVTLERFDSEIIEPIDVKFAPAAVSAEHRAVPSQGAANRAHRRAPRFEGIPGPKAEFEGEDPPDPIVDGQIDLGALLAEFLALGLDPYPRKPGVEFEEPRPAGEEDLAESPFSKLQALKGILPS